MPFPRYRFKGISGAFAPGPLLSFADLAGVNTCGNLFPGRVSLLPGIGKGYLGVAAQGKLFLFAYMPVLEPPQSTPCWRHEKKKAASVEVFDLFRLWFRIADFRIRKGHCPFRHGSYPPFWGHLVSLGGISALNLPPKIPDFDKYYSTILDTEQQKTRYF